MTETRNAHLKTMGSLDDLDTLKGLALEVEVEGRVRNMVYFHSVRTSEGTKRIFFGRTGNPNYVCQFIVADRQIEVNDGTLRLLKPYEKDLSRGPNGGFYAISQALKMVGL